MPEEESDVSFADFGGAKRLYPAPSDNEAGGRSSDSDVRNQDVRGSVERETGLEPATHSLGSYCSTN
jgi:hypothetical protein